MPRRVALARVAYHAARTRRHTYLLVGQLGRAFREIGLVEGDRETIVRNLISGQYPNAQRVVALNTTEGSSRDVSEDIAFEVLDRAFEADETLTDGTKRFIDRHINLGEKRPPAPSVRRGQDQATRRRA
jgi:hypothetical protein